MTNSIYIDIDTEREHPVSISKPPHINPPENREETAAMIVTDIASLSYAIKDMIEMAGDNGYAKKEALIEAVIKTINEAIEENKQDEQIQ